jgi:hypothetical protein
LYLLGFVTVAKRIKITLLCLSLSLSVRIVKSVIRRYLTLIECCLIFRIDGLVSNIWYQSSRFFNPLSAAISTCTTFGLALHLEKQRRKKANTSSNLAVLDQHLGVSQSAVLYFCDSNRLRWASCATTTSTVLHSTGQYSEGPVGSIPITVAVNRNRIGLKYCRIVNLGSTRLRQLSVVNPNQIHDSP